MSTQSPPLFNPHDFLFLSLCLDFPGFAFSLLLYSTQNTNIHATGGIRTRNASKRWAADPRLRRLGYWDRLGFRTLDRPAHSESLRAGRSGD